MNLLTVKQFSERHSAFTAASLRWLIFRAETRVTRSGLLPANGLAPAFIRCGRKVMIAEQTFFEILQQQNVTGNSDSSH